MNEVRQPRRSDDANLGEWHLFEGVQGSQQVVSGHSVQHAELLLLDPPHHHLRAAVQHTIVLH